MTRSLLAFTAAALVAVSASPVMAGPRAYEDNKLNFQDCKDANVTARWFKAELTISEAGKSPDDPSDSIEIKNWDGKCVNIRWDTDASHFVFSDGDASETGQMIKYVAWDGNLWAATRTYAGFFHARVADKGDSDPRSKMQAAGDWLAKNNINQVPAADVLAAILSSGGTSNN
ncbi:MAG TPA: hypothetical protein PK271_06425 [Hyphomicrobium sp.]|mgnify:CR=1 FL=1|uniref:hypothetical protein n=1 Tax=Hyphomicrobium sp. TaxID=82 RepID=UPI002D0C4F67|nr:hypothetical protein [Hyphomicrobium sp.]HRN88223.1 hypothetical protein [Hyphomicrobium sp.]